MTADFVISLSRKIEDKIVIFKNNDSLNEKKLKKLSSTPFFEIPRVSALSVE